MARRKTSVATATVHLIGPGKLKVINGRLTYAAHQADAVRLDADSLETLLCYGGVSVSDEAVRVILESGVQAAWLSPGGNRCRGRLVARRDGTTQLRLQQYTALAGAGRIAIARRIVREKIESQVAAARHYQRQGGRDVTAGLKQLRQRLKESHSANTLETLRGIEGTAGRVWFEMLGSIVQPPWQFHSRSRRPPTDPVNALLSLGYTFLVTRTIARCEAAGLEVNLGALHEFRSGRPSLACDLIEPLRVPIVDRWIVSLCNRHFLDPDDFVSTHQGVRLQPARFGDVVTWWEENWIASDHQARLDAAVSTCTSELRRYGRDTAIPLS